MQLIHKTKKLKKNKPKQNKNTHSPFCLPYKTSTNWEATEIYFPQFQRVKVNEGGSTIGFWLGPSSVSHCSLTQHKGGVGLQALSPRISSCTSWGSAFVSYKLPTNTIILGSGVSTYKFDGGNTHSLWWD